MTTTKPTHSSLPAGLSGTAKQLIELDMTGEDVVERLAGAVRADPRTAVHVLSLVGSEGTHAPVNTIEEACLHLGAPTVRALAIALDLCTSECRANPQTVRWPRPLALALASRAICRTLRVGIPTDAFIAGLLQVFGPETLAHWRLPAHLVSAVSPAATGQTECARNEDDSGGLSQILGQAAFFADALDGDRVRTSAEWARMSSNLEAIREFLELEVQSFAALFERIGLEWSDWHALLGLDHPRVPTIETLHRRAGVALADEDLLRALTVESSLPLKGLRILAVDDDPVSLKILERALSKAGHEVVTAVNGGDALRAALEVHPHAVIADWMMPEMDGLDLCKALRRSELGRSLFFLLLTGRGEEDRIVEAFDAGVDDYVTKPFNSKILMARLKGGQRVIELQERAEANRLVVMKQVAEMGLLTRKLRNAAHTDALTELPNRRHAMARLESEWSNTRPGDDRPLSVLLIDIDHFKKVNDTYGHDVGDLVLKEVAVVLRANARQGEEAARLGGEEFFVVCANATEAQARVAGERLRVAIERHVITGLGYHGSVTISVGVAQRTREMANQDALIKASDHAVYSAKALGRNCVVAFSDLGPVAQSA